MKQARLDSRCSDAAHVGLRCRASSQVSSVHTIGDAKTDRSYRIIELHSDLADWLTDQRCSSRDDSLVGGTSSGQPIDRTNFARSLRALSKRVHIQPVRPYDLHHTAITRQCQRGYRAWQVADWTGTSECMIYLYYRHVLTEVMGLLPIGWTDEQP